MRRAKRVRSVIRGTSKRPRLSVFRSNRAIYAQLIDDETGKTIAAAKALAKGALSVGKTLAEKAKKAGIARAVFDRGRYSYHGQVKAVAEGAREGGLKL